MNPLKWKREHQIALVLGIIVGVSLGLVLGYLVYATNTEAEDGYRFGSWMRQGISRGAHWWGLFGGAIGASVVSLKRLLSN